MADNKQIASDVLAAVGGKENVSKVIHCMTRLRFNLVDDTIPNDDEVKAIKGVLGIADRGTSGIEVVSTAPSADSHYFDLQGRRVEGTPQRPGLYIKQGRKIFVK